MEIKNEKEKNIIFALVFEKLLFYSLKYVLNFTDFCY